MTLENRLQEIKQEVGDERYRTWEQEALEHMPQNYLQARSIQIFTGGYIIGAYVKYKGHEEFIEDLRTEI